MGAFHAGRGASLSVARTDKDVLYCSVVVLGTCAFKREASHCGVIEVDTCVVAEVRGGHFAPAKFMCGGLLHGALKAVDVLETVYVSEAVPVSDFKALAEEVTEGIEAGRVTMGDVLGKSETGAADEMAAIDGGPPYTY